MTKNLDREKQKAQLIGYKSGFDSALKYVWALAEELLITVDNTEKDRVREFINKIKN